MINSHFKVKNRVQKGVKKGENSEIKNIAKNIHSVLYDKIVEAEELCQSRKADILRNSSALRDIKMSQAFNMAVLEIRNRIKNAGF